MRLLIGLILCFAYVNCKVFSECNGKPSKTYVRASHRQNNNCRSFIYCDGENSFEDMCSIGLAFNPVKLTCVPRESSSDDCDSDTDMNKYVPPVKSPSNPSKERIAVSVTTKQHPTPPGRPLGTTQTKSPTRSTTLKAKSNRPVPTRKPLGSTTFRPKPTPKPMRTNSPTKLTSMILSTTRRKTPMTSVSPNRPTTVPTKRPTDRPKTTVPTRGQSKNSSPIYIPTAPGSQNFPDRSKIPVLTTLPKEKEPAELSTERTLAVSSSTKSTKRTSAVSTIKSTERTSAVSSTKSHSKTMPPLILTSSTAAIEITESIEEQCIKKTVGNFADPDDCRYYYRCMRGVLNKQECPKGFGWDAKTKMCTSKGCLK